MNIVKKMIIKSYTKDYYFAKLDEIETIRMKSSLHNEFTSFVRYALSYMWIHLYTSIVDFFINTFIVLGVISIKCFLIIVVLILYVIACKLQFFI